MKKLFWLIPLVFALILLTTNSSGGGGNKYWTVGTSIINDSLETLHVDSLDATTITFGGTTFMYLGAGGDKIIGQAPGTVNYIGVVNALEDYSVMFDSGTVTPTVGFNGWGATQNIIFFSTTAALTYGTSLFPYSGVELYRDGYLYSFQYGYKTSPTIIVPGVSYLIVSVGDVDVDTLTTEELAASTEYCVNHFELVEFDSGDVLKVRYVESTMDTIAYPSVNVDYRYKY